MALFGDGSGDPWRALLAGRFAILPKTLSKLDLY
jgi:hypothetical protein